jgi:hypothetical protein
VKRGFGALVAVLFATGCATSPSSSPSASSSASTPAGEQWDDVELPHSAESFLVAVVGTEHEALVLGVAGESATAWASHDGGPWIEESMPPGFGYPSSAVTLGDRIVVLGGNQTDRCAHPGELVFGARDADARWSVAPFDPLFCAGGSAQIASNGEIAALLGMGTGDVAYSWVSNDGLAWTSRPIRQGISPSLLISAGSGFAAVGSFLENGGWWFGRSKQGEPWTIAPSFGPFAEWEAVGLADGGAGFLSWFTDAAAHTTALASETGDSWQSVAMDGLSDAEVRRVTKTAAGYVAFGRTPGGPRLFVSRDGIAWRRASGPSDDSPSSYTSLALSGDRALLLGTVHTGPDMDATALWSARASLFTP